MGKMNMARGVKKNIWKIILARMMFQMFPEQYLNRKNAQLIKSSLNKRNEKIKRGINQQPLAIMNMTVVKSMFSPNQNLSRHEGEEKKTKNQEVNGTVKQVMVLTQNNACLRMKEVITW